MDLGSSRSLNGGTPPMRRSASSRSTGEGGACHLPPLPRPPSAEDVDIAKHLVLLKAKMPERWRLQRQRSAGPVPRGDLPNGQQRGRSVPPRPNNESPRDQARGGLGEEARAHSRRRSPKVRSSSPHAPSTHPPESHNDLHRGGDEHGDRRNRRSDAENRPRMHTQEQPHDGRQKQQSHPDGRMVAEIQEQPPRAMAFEQEAPPMPEGINLPTDAFGGGEDLEMVKCEGCGRSFRAEALERHAKICKKVFQDKRKQFNSAANRLGELENANQLIKNASQIEKEVAQVKKQQDAQKDHDHDAIKHSARKPAAKEQSDKPIPKWKKQSLEFRAAMLATKAANGDEKAAKEAKEVKAELSALGGDDPASDPTKTVCPHCGRSFNNESAQRHIDICLKMFGGKPGGGRLVRGGGRSCNAPKSAGPPAQVPTAVRNETSAAARGAAGRRASGGGGPTAAEEPASKVAQHPRHAPNEGPRAGNRGPPPLPGGRSSSREGRNAPGRR